MPTDNIELLNPEQAVAATCGSVLNALPESLVSFESIGLARATVLFRNVRLAANISNSELLARYAFATKSRDLLESFDARRKTFQADRYGGAGLIHNGGSGRCGCDGEFQVKGIGRTPLVGRDVIEKYSSGMITVRDAALEAAYGEISHSILPFGGIRSLAILGTNTLIKQHNGKLAPRGLLVREATLRPAHFERAVYFRPRSHFLAGRHPHDSDRTAAAIHRLPGILQRVLLAGQTGFQNVSELLIAGLTSFAERLASQVAAAQAKRLMHGSMTSSNLALDGRWLDFGSTTCLPLDNFGADSPYLPFWCEADTVLRSLNEILFFVQKYIPEFRPVSSHAFNVISGHYLTRLSTESRFRQLLLTGVPQPVLRLMPTQERSIDSLVQAFLKIARLGFKPPAELDHLSDSRLGAIALILSRHFRDPVCEARLRPYLSNAVQPNELIDTYQAFIGMALEAGLELGVAPAHFMRATRINALRFSRYPAFMYRPKLVRLIDDCLDAAGDDATAQGTSLTQLLNTVQEQSEALLADSTDMRIPLWVQGTTSLQFDMAEGFWRFTNDGETWSSLSHRDFETVILTGPVGRALQAHFGPGFVEFI